MATTRTTRKFRDLTVANSSNTPDVNDKLGQIAVYLQNITDTGTLPVSAVDGQVVSGPSTPVTSGNVALFDGTTGKQIKDSGKLPPVGAFVGTTDTQTLTNKTLTAPVTNGGTIAAVTSFGVRSTGSGAFDFIIRNTENLTANRTLTVIVNNGDRQITITANATISGTNTGDQIVPNNTPAVTHQFITAYTASTGVLTQAQPSATDLSNGVYGTGRVLLDNGPQLTNPLIVGTGGNLRLLGLSSSAADPTTSDLPNNKDASIHKNTGSGNVYLAYNDSGTIKKVQLT